MVVRTRKNSNKKTRKGCKSKNSCSRKIQRGGVLNSLKFWKKQPKIQHGTNYIGAHQKLYAQQQRESQEALDSLSAQLKRGNNITITGNEIVKHLQHSGKTPDEQISFVKRLRDSGVHVPQLQLEKQLLQEAQTLASKEAGPNPNLTPRNPNYGSSLRGPDRLETKIRRQIQGIFPPSIEKVVSYNPNLFNKVNPTRLTRIQKMLGEQTTLSYPERTELAEKFLQNSLSIKYNKNKIKNTINQIIKMARTHKIINNETGQSKKLTPEDIRAITNYVESRMTTPSSILKTKRYMTNRPLPPIPQSNLTKSGKAVATGPTPTREQQEYLLRQAMAQFYPQSSTSA